MNGKQLKNSILQLAIQGKLVPQNPDDEPATELLKRIKQEKQRLVKEGKLKKSALNDSTIFKADDGNYYETQGKTTRCIDEQIPFDIPDSWTWCRLTSIASVYGGKRIPNGTKLIQTDTKHKYIRVTDMKDCTIRTDDIHFVTDEIYEKIKQYTITKEDLYITVAGTIGKVGEVPIEFDNANLTENADKLVFRNINKRFLMYALLSDVVQMQIRECTTKVGQPKLAIIRIQSLLLPLPPLAEQHRIVEKIEEVMPYVVQYGNAQEELDKLNGEIKDTLKKSILQEAIKGRLVPQDPDDEPACLLLKRIKQEKEKLVKTGKLKKSALSDSTIFKTDDGKYYEKEGKETLCVDDVIPFEIPQSWEWTKMGVLFSHNNGKQLNKGNSKGKLMDYITTSNLYWNGFVLDNLCQMPFEDNEIERCMAIKGDLLVCEGGDVGRSCIWNYDYPIMLQNHIHKLRAYLPINTKYFFYVFYAYNLSGLIGGKGIGIQGFSSKALHNTYAPLPPLSEQYRIVAKIEELFQVLDKSTL